MVSKTYQYKIIKLSVAIMLSLLILLPLANDQTWYDRTSIHQHALDTIVHLYDGQLDWDAYRLHIDQYISVANLDAVEPVIMMTVANPYGTPHNNQMIQLTPYEDTLQTAVKKFRPEELGEVHQRSRLNGYEFRIFYSTRYQLVIDSILSLIRTIVVCILLATVVFYLTQDAKQLLLNPIERIAVKVGKIALNPAEATNQDFENPEKLKILELMHQEDGNNRVDQTMESAILERSMTLIIYLLAAAIGYSGTAIVARNITSSGEFQMMVPGKRHQAIIVTVNIDHFKEIVFVLKNEVTQYVNLIAEIIHSQTNKFQGVLASQ